MIRVRVKLIITAVIFLTAVIFVVWSVTKLEKYYDIAEFVFRDDIREQISDLRSREIISVNVVDRYVNMYASEEAGRTEEVTVYAVDPGFRDFIPNRMVHSNFLVDLKPVFMRGQVIIGESLAVALFARTDAADSDVLINGMNYSVIGVIAKDNVLIDIFGSLEKHAVYVYSGDVQAGLKPERTSLIVKCRENTAGMVLSGISASGLNAIAEINHDAKARFNVFASQFLLLIGICMILRSLIKQLVLKLRDNKRVGYINRVNFIYIVFIIIFISAALYLLSGLRFVLDARMIPGTLANFGVIFNKIREWFYLVNTGMVNGGLLSVSLNLYARLAVYSSLVSVISGWLFSKYMLSIS